MTSHARSGPNTYNGVQAPRYNIMSYTWGHYEDPNGTHPSLPVRGVNWPIPCIKKEHFTSDMFLDAIRRVAQGTDKGKCDWVWIDVACIPQEWAGESCEDAALRGQEIGRQVGIFQKAEEVFAWLNGIQKADIVKDQQDLALSRHINYVGWQNISEATNKVEFVNGRWQELEYLEAVTLAYERYMKRILEHPWFQSLWTLQEMVLRSNGECTNGGYILFDGDDLSENTLRKRAREGRLRKWRRHGTLRYRRWEEHMSLHVLTTESDAMEHHVLSRLREKIQQISTSCRTHDVASVPQDGQPDLERIYQRLEDLTSLQNRRGLIPASVTVPHTVYSLASLRRVTHLVDRIYGIVQVYGIVCNPNPKGHDELAKLHSLEDEFGIKLVEKAPVLSQLFLHSSADETPRRSWLITQKCNSKLMGERGRQFKTNDEIKGLFEVFKVIPGPRGFDGGDLLLRFRGKAWSLGVFMESFAWRPGKLWLSSTFDTTSYLVSKDEARGPPCCHMEDHYKLKLNTAAYFVSSGNPWNDPWDEYGLKLDYHISKSIFGHVVGNFPAEFEIHNAIYRIFQYYNRPYNNGVKGLGTVVVALLGSRWLGRVPSVQYVGMVLVCRDSSENPGGCHADADDSLPASRRIHSNTTWERIGLIVWHETHYTPDYTPHDRMPPPYVFQCSII